MLCVFYHNFLKWGKKSKSRDITPPLKETGSVHLQSRSQDSAGSNALLIILMIVSSGGSSWPPAIGQTLSRSHYLFPPGGPSVQLTFEGWREEPQGGLVTPSPHCFSLGFVGLAQPHSSLCPGLHFQHNLETALSWGTFISDGFLLRVKVR